MDGREDTAVGALLEHLIEHGPGDIATAFGRAFELAMQIERQRFLRAGPDERTAERQGYLPLEPDAARLLFQFVSRRYEKGAVLITFNRTISACRGLLTAPLRGRAGVGSKASWPLTGNGLRRRRGRHRHAIRLLGAAPEQRRSRGRPESRGRVTRGL